MEETEKSFKFLSDCAEVAEKLKTNTLFNEVKIKINVPSKNYLLLLKESERIHPDGLSFSYNSDIVFPYVYI